MNTAAAIQALARPHGLMVMGGVHSPPGVARQTLFLIGCGDNFWPIFTQSPEYHDKQPDPLDRWSTRILSDIAQSTIGGRGVVFPFTGPPYAPFIQWAKDSGEAYQSPSGMLVHRKAGLMISYRGGVVVAGRARLPADRYPAPCVACADEPCATTCPVNALSAERGYDVAACHAFLDTDAGQDCLTRGCKARRACPVSQRFGRLAEQSAFHMQSFHPT